MEDIIRLLFEIIQFILGMLAGLIFGRRAERRHLASLAEREARHRGVLVTDSKLLPPDCDVAAGGELLIAEVCIASDYLKSFLARVKNFFGGELRAFETLLARARREALMRLIEQAAARGYDTVINVRLETADIGGSAEGRAIPFASILGYATGCRRLPPVDRDPVAGQV